MRTGRIIVWATALVAMAGPLAYGQAAAATVAGPRFLITSLAPVAAQAVPAGDIVREIDDPRNDDRWLLVRDGSHPGGPGLLLLVSAVRVQSRQVGPELVAQPIIIRAGDHVIVEENTPVVEARLEAVAMGPATAGSPFIVRLTMGGRVLRAVASGPGRALLQEEARR
jgi:hypothetical protein